VSGLFPVSDCDYLTATRWQYHVMVSIAMTWAMRGVASSRAQLDRRLIGLLSYRAYRDCKKAWVSKTCIGVGVLTESKDK
jgi:hypothetical protein